MRAAHGRSMNPDERPSVWFPAIRSGSGADVYTLRLAEALEKRGIRAEIAWLPLRAEYAPWSVPVPKPPAWANVVHINSWLPPRFIPRNLPILATLHSCVHDPALTPYKSTAQALYHRLWIKAIEAENLRNAAKVVAVSRYAAREAQAVFGQANIEVIYNWVDTGLFHPAPRETPHHPFRLLFVGKWRRLKGTDLLAPILRCLGPDFVLRFTAKGSPGASRDLPPNLIPVAWLNESSQLARLYRESDALLFPSRLEGLSLTMLEAQASGLPVIASDGSSLPEVVEDGATGLLCPVDDVDAFAAAARFLAENPARWREMAHAARRRAVERFAEEAALDRYVRLYNEIV
jgi:glycosyltransferase involved in cell wall biosynthesis